MRGLKAADWELAASGFLRDAGLLASGSLLLWGTSGAPDLKGFNVELKGEALIPHMMRGGILNFKVSRETPEEA